MLTNSSNKVLSGINLKFKNAVTNSLYTLFTSSCIAFGLSYTSTALANTSSNASQDAWVYWSLLSFNPSTLSINAFNAVLSPLIKSNICIALAKRSNALFICSWLAFASL